MRRFAWKHKPTTDDEKLLQLIARSTSSSSSSTASPSTPPLFLVAEPGVTQFIVQAADVKHRVLIGDSQTCSCGRAREGVRLCRHLLFVMLRVMRLSPDDPLAWQLSLTEAEIQTVLKGRWEWRAERKRRGTQGNEKETGEQEAKQDGKVRRAVEAEDVCVVCQEEMLGSEGGTHSGGLCWCESGCGCALHARCMRVWAEHQAQTASSHQAITCPVSAPSRLRSSAAAVS
jgi:E3 ubiquitin-protein ligase ZSWIM2